MCFSLGPWPLSFQILAYDRLNFDFLVGALERGEIDLAVALPAVRVAGPDQAAFLEHRKIQDGTHLQLVKTHVRAVLPWPKRARAPGGIVDRRPCLGGGLVRVHAHRKR